MRTTTHSDTCRDSLLQAAEIRHYG